MIDEYLIDIFLTAYTIQLFVYAFLALRAMAHVKEMRNLFNMLIFLGISFFLIDRLINLAYARTAAFDGTSMLQVYSYFQLPQDSLNVALIAQVFQWIEVSLTLQNISFLRDKRGGTIRTNSQVTSTPLTTP